jgi:Transglycosylase SLT domain
VVADHQGRRDQARVRPFFLPRRNSTGWHRAIRILALVAAAGAVLAALNWVFQLVRKPSEAFFPLDSALAKTPAQTWREYGALFREHSTALMTPELLAALAQIESTGNPVARTYWRWRAAWNPSEVYRPASSAVGMYQITDARFAEAKRYCIHNHVALDHGPWYDGDSCWFNVLYLRVLPSDAIEMTSAFLDRRVAQMLARQRIASATLQQKQDLAAVIHLCGATAGDAYARRGLRPAPGERCGDHDLHAYLRRLNALKRFFLRLS